MPQAASETDAGDVASVERDVRQPGSRGERTARRLRTAARQVFASGGYAAARVEDIVAAAGVSHGTFYTYYDNKAAVLDALVDETAEALTKVVDEPWEGADVAATIQGVIARFVAIFGDDGDVIRTWVEASAHERHFRERLREVRAGYVERVAAQLRPAVAGTDHDATVAAGALVAMVEGYATQGLGADDAAHRDLSVETLTTLWFGGLRQLLDDAGRR